MTTNCEQSHDMFAAPPDHAKPYRVIVCERNWRGLVGYFPTLEAGRAQAIARVDDALPHNHIVLDRWNQEMTSWVRVGHAAWGGDGEAYFEPTRSRG